MKFLSPVGAQTRRARLNPAERRFGNKPLLEWVVRRVTDSLLIDQVIVLVDTAQGDTILRLRPSDVAVFVSPQADSLSRLAAALRKFDAQKSSLHYTRQPVR